MQTHQTDFSTGNVYRNIMEVAVPMIIAQILNLLYNIVDRIYIGRIPEIGATALTGVGLCFPIITLITAFTYLFGNGGAPLCSMERGRGNREEAEMLMGNTFVMLIGTGVILTAIGLIFYRPILYAFGASDVTFSYAADYIRIYLLGTLFVMITLGMNPFINSQGFGNTGMLTILIGAVLNILLDPLLHPHHGNRKSRAMCCSNQLQSGKGARHTNPRIGILHLRMFFCQRCHCACSKGSSDVRMRICPFPLDGNE